MNPLKKVLITLAISLSWLTSPLLIQARDETKSQSAPQEWRLGNGTNIICLRDSNSPVTVLQLVIGGGKRVESENRLGLGYLTHWLILQLADDSDRRTLIELGSRITFDLFADYSQFTIECLTDNLDETLRIFVKGLTNPLFSDIRIDALKKHLKFLQTSAGDDPVDLMNQTVCQAFFGRAGYGANSLGTAVSVESITRRDISEYFSQQFNAANLTVILATDREIGILQKTVEKYFRKISARPPGAPQELQPVIPNAKKHAITLNKERIQAHVARAFLLPEITPRRYVLNSLLETLLGKGINSRLWSLRTTANLAYGLSAGWLPMKQAGVLTLFLKTSADREKEAATALPEVVQRLYQQGVSDSELQTTKAYCRAEFWRQSESKKRGTASLALFEALGLGYRFAATVVSEIDAVSLAEMNAYIRQVLNPETCLEMSIGTLATPESSPPPDV